MISLISDLSYAELKSIEFIEAERRVLSRVWERQGEANLVKEHKSKRNKLKKPVVQHGKQRE